MTKIHVKEQNQQQNPMSSNSSASNSKDDMEHCGYGGEFQRTASGYPIDTSQPGLPVYHRKFANPAPLGLMSFATCIFIISLCDVHARNIPADNIIVGPAIAFGGITQLLAGMWEFASGNTFGATTFCVYGGMWIANAVIRIPGFGVEDAYTAHQMQDAIGFFQLGFWICTFCIFLASLKTSVSMILSFITVQIVFLTSAAYCFTGNVALQKTSGCFGLITAFLVWYTSLTGLLTPESTFISVPKGEIQTFIKVKNYN